MRWLLLGFVLAVACSGADTVFVELPAEISTSAGASVVVLDGQALVVAFGIQGDISQRTVELLRPPLWDDLGEVTITVLQYDQSLDALGLSEGRIGGGIRRSCDVLEPAVQLESQFGGGMAHSGAAPRRGVGVSRF